MRPANTLSTSLFRMRSHPFSELARPFRAAFTRRGATNPTGGRGYRGYREARARIERLSLDAHNPGPMQVCASPNQIGASRGIRISGDGDTSGAGIGS